VVGWNMCGMAAVMKTVVLLHRVEVPEDFTAVTGFDPAPHVKGRSARLGRFIFSPQYPLGLQGSPCMKLNDIVIDERYQGQGLGTAIVSAVCRYADAKALAVWLTVTGSGRTQAERAMNTVRLITWYGGFGFTEPTSADVARHAINGCGLPARIRHPEPANI
jgi:GNAT superfamily N-acetyltransferase